MTCNDGVFTVPTRWLWATLRRSCGVTLGAGVRVGVVSEHLSSARAPSTFGESGLGEVYSGVRVLPKTGVEGFFEFGDLAVGFRQ